MTTTHTAFVFFAAHRGRRWSMSWWIAALTRSPLVHCAISDGEIVIDPSCDGEKMWGHALYAMRYPDLVWCIEVPVHANMELARWQDRRPKSAVPSLLRWLTRGLWPTKDCVQLVLSALRRGKIATPRRMVGPGDLFDWLRAEGHTIHDLEDDSASGA